MEGNLNSILTLFGGLALFLYGMDELSRGLEAAAGERMRALLAALTGGLWSGVAVAVLSPFCAYALGIGPAFLQLVPCVALGNAVYAVLFALLVGKWLTAKPLAAWGSMVLAAVCKLAALYVVLVKLVAPMIVPAAKLTAVTAAFTWPQLVTALIGGVLACLIAPPVRRALEK